MVMTPAPKLISGPPCAADRVPFAQGRRMLDGDRMDAYPIVAAPSVMVIAPTAQAPSASPEPLNGATLFLYVGAAAFGIAWATYFATPQYFSKGAMAMLVGLSGAFVWFWANSQAPASPPDQRAGQ